MDLEKAKNEFLKYTSKYDIKNANIDRKIWHSIRVMEISKIIAKNLNLTTEKIELASLIGLLHDIARFEQWKIYGTYKDSISCDHGDLGVVVLKESNFIRNFIEEDKYDKIILTSIKNHNKYKIGDNLNNEELLFSKIIRDADKLDIMYEGIELFWQDKEEINAVEQSDITPEAFNEFLNNKTINKIYNKLPADNLIVFIAFIFDINFECSFNILQKEDYINRILNRFNFKNKDKFEKIREIANIYIENRNKG